MKIKHIRSERVRSGHPRRWLGATALVAASVTVLAGCGSDGGSAADAGSSVDGADASACVSQAKAKVEAASKPIRFTAPTAPVDMAKVAGKKVFYIAPDMSIPFIQSIAKGFEEAAKAAGLDPVIFDGKANVNTFNQGVSAAVAQKAAGILLQGENPSLVSGPLADATAAKIAVVDSLNGDPGDPLGGGVQAHVTVDYSEGGRLMADDALARSGCTGDLVFFTSSIYSVYTNMLKGFKAEVKALCPGCGDPVVVDADPSSYATKLPTLTTTALTRHPKSKVFVAAADSMIGFMTPSIQEAGSSVVIVGHDGVQSNLDQIRSGSSAQVSSVANPPNEALGWAEVDQLGRLMTGGEPVTPSLPQQLLDKDNITADYSGLFPGYADYQAGYQKLWGVS